MGTGGPLCVRAGGQASSMRLEVERNPERNLPSRSSSRDSVAKLPPQRHCALVGLADLRELYKFTALRYEKRL